MVTAKSKGSLHQHLTIYELSDIYGEALSMMLLYGDFLRGS